MYLLSFRKCNEVLNLNTNPYCIKRYVSGEFNTIGFYYIGLNKDILALYVYNNQVYLKINYDFPINFLKLNFICKELKNNLWALYIKEGEADVYTYKYKSFFFYEDDDDSEEDVNYGLWIISLMVKSKRSRFIKANTTHQAKPQ